MGSFSVNNVCRAHRYCTSRSVQGLVAGSIRAGLEAWLLALKRGEEPWVDGIEIDAPAADKTTQQV